MRVGVPERALACARPHIAACSVAEIIPRLVDERRASAFNRSLSVFASFSSCEIILWLAFVIGSFSVTPAILPFARLRASATMKREFAFRHSLSLPSLLTCSCQRMTLSVSFFTVGNMSVRAPNVACFLSPMVGSRSRSGGSGTQRPDRDSALRELWLRLWLLVSPLPDAQLPSLHTLIGSVSPTPITGRHQQVFSSHRPQNFQDPLK